MKAPKGRLDEPSIATHYKVHAVRNDLILTGLLKEIASGDRRAYKKLYDLIGGQLLRIVSNILRNDVAAEDALQEALLRIWRYAGRYEPARGTPMAWMGTIARNAAFDFGKAPVTHVDETTLDNLEFSTPPQDPPDQKLAQCLKRLPAEQGNAIILMYTYGLSHAELALYLGVPLGTVKSWVTRGTNQLRSQILDVGMLRTVDEQ